VIMLTAHADIATVVEAMRRGARDCLGKPFPSEAVRHAVTQAIACRQADGAGASAQVPAAGVVIGGDCTNAEVERAHTRAVLARARSLDQAARILGIDPSTLYRRRRRLQ
jgi:DNA-binding NtrC family response regulator